MNSFESELLDCCFDHQVINKEDTCVVVKGEWNFPLSFSGFQGHFPSQPVLPAVIQLTMVRLLAEKALNLLLFPSSYGRTKFRRIIEPERRVITELTLNVTENTVDCEFQLKQPDGQMICNGSNLFTYR